MARLPLPLTDDSLMPFGKHKGQKLGNVPDGYLLFIYDNYDLKPDMKKYIETNLNVIKTNIKREEQKKSGEQ